MSIQEPEQFRLLYNCRIEPTGEKIYKVPPYKFPNIPVLTLPPEIIASHESEPIIAIKMPEGEYLRFMQNWNQYMNLMHTASANPLIKEQYHQLLMLVELYK